jgi:NAD(P)H-dependent FMN reductase
LFGYGVSATNHLIDQATDMPLRETLSNTWDHIQGFLFPMLREEVGPLTAQHERLVIVLDVARVEAFVQMWSGLPGRPLEDRHALARAFVAKVVLNLPTTAGLIERLAVDATLRQLCGWERASQVPSESTFSRAFAEFAVSALPSRVHEALIKKTHQDRLVGHIARDATAIEVREKPVRSAPAALEAPKRRRGRPKKGEVIAKPAPRRLERQAGMTLAEMLADLPSCCDVGTKRNAKGHTTSWIGYKLHIDTADGDIPISCVLTSASVHDSQVALPLATITASRVTNLYDLMDSAYDAPEISAQSLALGHVPIIEPNPRRGGKNQAETEARAKRCAGYELAEHIRYNQRSAAERVNGNLKDNCGGNHVRVRGAPKVFCHLMFGILVVTVEQIMRLVT